MGLTRPDGQPRRFRWSQATVWERLWLLLAFVFVVSLLGALALLIGQLI